MLHWAVDPLIWRETLGDYHGAYACPDTAWIPAFMRLTLRRAEDKSWPEWGLSKRLRNAGGGGDLEKRSTWSRDLGLGQSCHFRSFWLICKMRIVIIHTSQGLREDQTRKKGCENYINCKALHKEGSYDWLIPSQSVFQRKLNKLPQTFHSQGYFYFVIFQASKWNWKKKQKTLSGCFLYGSL